MSYILDVREDPTPTTADCIKLLYDFESSNEIEEPDEMH